MSRKIIESETSITGVQKRLDNLRNRYIAKSDDAGLNFGNAIWKTVLGSLGMGMPIWHLFFSRTEQESIGTGVGYLIFFGVGALASAGVGVDIFEGRAKLKLNNDIMEEITSLKSALTRRYDVPLDGNSPD